MLDADRFHWRNYTDVREILMEGQQARLEIWMSLVRTVTGTDHSVFTQGYLDSPVAPLFRNNGARRVVDLSLAAHNPTYGVSIVGS